jgi:hypothetical protein
MNNKLTSILIFILIITNKVSVAQTNQGIHFGGYATDTSKFVSTCYEYGIIYVVPKRYEDLIFYGPCINVKNSCLNRCFGSRIKNKKHDFIVGVQFQHIISKETEAKTKKWFNSDYDRNKNYLGGKICKVERDSGLIDVFSAKDIKRINADTAICFRGGKDSFYPYMEKYDHRIAVVMHKHDRGDITVQFLYLQKDEKAVLKQINRIWEIIKFD